MAFIPAGPAWRSPRGLQPPVLAVPTDRRTGRTVGHPQRSRLAKCGRARPVRRRAASFIVPAPAGVAERRGCGPNVSALVDGVGLSPRCESGVCLLRRPGGPSDSEPLHRDAAFMKPRPSQPRSRPGDGNPGAVTPIVGGLRGCGGWATLVLSVAIYAAVSIAMHQPFHAGGLKLRFFDLSIYHLAALRLVHASSLYGTPMLHHLGFTYPPFAALLLAPLASARLSVDELVVTGLNILLLVWTLRRALMLTSRGRAPERPTSLMPARTREWSQAAGLAAAALWLEPISVTLGYGQINLLIVALVVFDLSRSEAARTKGIAIGVAAAIKLTPLLFIAYLMFSRRGRAAWFAAATFAMSIVIGFAAVPHDASTYWGGAVLSTSRVGNVADPMNQSLMGAIARLTGTRHPASAWELLVAAIALSGVALAARASRGGDEAAGFSLAAITALLTSPISWPHHWTLAVPALVLLARRAHERRSRAHGAAVAILGLVGYTYLPELVERSFNSTHGLASLPITDPYPLVAVSVLAVYAFSLARTWLRQLRLPTGRRDELRDQLRPQPGSWAPPWSGPPGRSVPAAGTDVRRRVLAPRTQRGRMASCSDPGGRS